jgi:hypothetical protein
MAIIIRTAYNNKGWNGKCDYPGKDPLCWQCFTGDIRVHGPNKNDVVCSGDCWESRIYKDLKWGCTPKGRLYGPDAYPGVTVYLIFTQPDGKYTIWGKTKASSVDGELMSSGKDFEDGFSFIHFAPFEPLPRDKWITDLTDVQLVGTKWLQGRHRYIHGSQEQYIQDLIEGKANPYDTVPEQIIAESKKIRTVGNQLNTVVTEIMFEKLIKIASEEGRTVDELVRQAIADFVRSKHA